jgi:hypothetical protein
MWGFKKLARQLGPHGFSFQKRRFATVQPFGFACRIADRDGPSCERPLGLLDVYRCAIEFDRVAFLFREMKSDSLKLPITQIYDTQAQKLSEPATEVSDLQV